MLMSFKHIIYGLKANQCFGALFATNSTANSHLKTYTVTANPLTMSLSADIDSQMMTKCGDEESGAAVTAVCLTDQPVDQQKTETKSQLTPKSQTKEEPRFRKVESRYKQSTQQWVNRRTDDVHTKHEPIINGSANRCRNPTPNAKKSVKQASTPMSTNKPMNVSGISVIHKVIANNESKPNLKKYSKPLVTGRTCVASKRLPFGSDSDVKEAVSAPTTRSHPVMVGHDNDIKVKEMDNSILVSIYLSTLLLNLKAKQMQSQRIEKTFTKMTQIWSQTNDIRTQMMETKKCLVSLQNTIDSNSHLQKQKTYLEHYLMIRTEMNSLFNNLSELIVGQKLLIRVENCDQNDFKKLNELVDNLDISNRFESFEKISIASTNIENSMNTCNEIKSMETEFNECYKTFIKCFNDLDKYQKKLNKTPLLSKLF